MKKATLLCLMAAVLTTRAEPVTLTVSAAASLKAPLESLKAEFEKAVPGVAVVYNFGSSGSLQQQIVNGASADVFISAAAKQMDELEKGGFIEPGSRFVLAGNTVVLVAPAGSGALGGFDGLTADAIKVIAIGEPKTVPAGMYAMEVLEHLGIAERVGDKLVFAKDVRQVMVYVESGNADAGFVYGSDAVGSKAVRLVASAPAASHKKVEYPAAVIRASAHAAQASAFLKFLRSPESSALFKAAGFDMNTVR
ncbi:MAG: molybdate ABC transporter substrate-binding protein [Terrimicrobiaceae bacterium]